MEFFDALVRYEVALWAAVEHELSQHSKIGLGHLHALRVIKWSDGQARVQDLSDDIGITVGASSKLVDRLERDGLAARIPNPANRRSSLIVLTAAGERAVIDGTTVFESAVARAIGSEDVEGVTAVLRRLRHRLADSGVGVAA